MKDQLKEIQMNCWHCNTELIWGGDHDCDASMDSFLDYSIETNLSCPECGCLVLVYYPKDEPDYIMR